MRTALFTLIALANLIIGCTGNNSNNSPSKQAWLDTTAFPKKAFLKVVLYVLDSASQTTRYSPSERLTVKDTSKVEYIGDGYTFVNRAGMPKTSEYRAYTLDSTQVQELLKHLKQQPCTSEIMLDKSCSPTYRHVYVFYDRASQPFAQVHVCFSCETAAFQPTAEYMCNFDNKVNYIAFKSFTNKIYR